MKFMILILAFAFTDGIQQRKIIRTAVFYDEQVVNWATPSPATIESTRDPVLRLVQKANNLLNEADLHIQLVMNVSELGPIPMESKSAEYWRNVTRHMDSIFPGSKNESQRYAGLTQVVLILSNHPAMREKWNRPSFVIVRNSPCGSSLPSVIPVSVEKKIRSFGENRFVRKTGDEIAASMAARLLYALGMAKDSCIPDYGMIHLPLCAVNFTQSLGGEAFRCYTDKPVVMDHAVPICNNSIREAGEECDCGSCDSACRKSCDTSSCRNITSPDPTASPTGDGQLGCALGPGQTGGDSPGQKNPDGGKDDPKPKKGNNSLIIGIAVIVVLLAVVLIAVLLYYLRRRGRRMPVLLPVPKKRRRSLDSEHSEPRALSDSPVPSHSLRSQSQGSGRYSFEK